MRIPGLSDSGPAGAKRGSFTPPAGWAVFALTGAGLATLDNDRPAFHSGSGLSPQGGGVICIGLPPCACFAETGKHARIG